MTYKLKWIIWFATVSLYWVKFALILRGLSSQKQRFICPSHDRALLHMKRDSIWDWVVKDIVVWHTDTLNLTTCKYTTIFKQTSLFETKKQGRSEKLLITGLLFVILLLSNHLIYLPLHLQHSIQKALLAVLAFLPMCLLSEVVVFAVNSVNAWGHKKWLSWSKSL